MNEDVLGLILVAVLILFNGFFVAAEFSLVSVRRTRVEEMVAQKRPGALALSRATDNLDIYIAATQLGITLASLGLGWVGEPAFSHLVDPLVELLPIPADWGSITSHSISAAVAFMVITFLHVVLGELTPKAMALQSTESVSLVVAQPMTWIANLFKPGVWVLNGAGNIVLRLLGFRPAAGHEMVHSVEEIKLVMAASADQGVLGHSEVDMVDSIFDLRNMLVRQVMIPRTEIRAFSAGATLRDVIAGNKEEPHEKFPVYEQDIDHIVGILYLRDVLDQLSQGKLDTPIRGFAREAIFVPETARFYAAVRTFREKRQHVAVVLDEYGGTAGLLTLEDVMEEIAGEVPDQFDAVERPDILKRGSGRWEISGLALIDQVNDALGLSLKDDNYDTIGGYVMGMLERIPAKGDQVTVDGFVFEVEQVEGKRVDRLVVQNKTAR